MEQQLSGHERNVLIIHYGIAKGEAPIIAARACLLLGSNAEIVDGLIKKDLLALNDSAVHPTIITKKGMDAIKDWWKK